MFERILTTELTYLFVPTAKGLPNGLTAKIPGNKKDIAGFIANVGKDLIHLTARMMPSLLADPALWALVALNLTESIGSAKADAAMKKSLNKEMADTKNAKDANSRSSRAGIRQYVIDKKIDLGNGIAQLRKAGFYGATAFDLADGKSLSEFKLNAKQAADFRKKINSAAISAPNNSNLKKNAESAYRNGMTNEKKRLTTRCARQAPYLTVGLRVA